jgi:hypothetical protein
VLLVIGVLLVVLGVLTLAFGGFPVERNAIEIGDASIAITETRTVPQWAGWAGLVVGAVLAALGLASKK